MGAGQGLRRPATPRRRRGCAACSATSSRRCRLVGLAAAPFLPGTAPRLLAQLGHAYPYAPDGNGGPPILDELAWGAHAAEAGRLTAPEPLFPRLDVEAAETPVVLTRRSAVRADASMAAMRLIDSHCHLNADRFEADADQVLGAARLAGVERILVPGWNVASSERALACVDRFGWLDAAVGVHPHDAAKVDDAAGRGSSAGPRTHGSSPSVRPGSTMTACSARSPTSSTNLRRNLELALETGKPAILHCRSADGRRDAQDALVGSCGRPGSAGRLGRRRSATGRRRSSTRSPARPTTRGPSSTSASRSASRGSSSGAARRLRPRPSRWCRPTAC